MKLRYSTTSPYVRKAMITAHETGLIARIELVLTDAWSPETDLGGDNPLGKVPALLTDGGEYLYDSPVICEYLDSLHDGAKLFPASGGPRWTALRRQALGDGIMDAVMQIRIERSMRPAIWDKWVARQSAAIIRALDVLEEEIPAPGRFTIGEIAVVAALGFIDLRYDELGWRDKHPRLAAWFETQSARPSVAATVPK